MLGDVGLVNGNRRLASSSASSLNEVTSAAKQITDWWSGRVGVFFAIATWIALGPATSALGAIPTSERAVLDAMYVQTNGDQWIDNTGWEGEAGTECSWHGITCDADQTHITGLGLQYNNLSGSLPSISTLSALTSFIAYGNNLSGQIPSLAGLTQLKNFDVDTNRLTGPIPLLTGLTALMFFRVDSNALTGTIPSLAGLTSLSYFSVARNYLSGSIPPLVGLRALRTFDASANVLTGPIPPIDDLGALRNLYLESNQLIGPPPAVPNPSNLVSAGSSLCPNRLTPVIDTAWDAATGDSPWYYACQPRTLYVALNPARLLDTRVGSGNTTVDGVAQGTGPIAAASIYRLPVTGRAGIPAGVVAVALNVTPVDPAVYGYFTVWSGIGATPNASNLNLNPNYTIPNLVISPVDASGQVAIFNGSNAVENVVVDVQGYFPSGSPYVPVTPRRLLDTRNGSQTVDGQYQGAGALGSRMQLDLSIAGRPNSVPAWGVGAVIVNLTAAVPGGAGYVTAWPSGQALPIASNLNLNVGLTIPNLVISGLGAGDMSLFNGGADATDLIADVQGWFPTSSGYTALTPARLLDTRSGENTIDGQFEGIGPVATTGTLDLQVTGRGGVPSDTSVGAVVLNVTAVQPTARGYMTVWPTGSSQPLASNLNLNPGITIPNLVIAKVGDDGKVSIFNGAQAPTDILVDVQGWLPADR